MSTRDPRPPTTSRESRTPADGPVDFTVPIEGATCPGRARTWARSTMQTTLATTLPAWKIAALGLALLGVLIFFGLNAALVLAAAFFLIELVVLGWAARQAGRRSEPALRPSAPLRPNRPPPRSPAPQVQAPDPSRNERHDLQRWEDEGGATMLN